MKDIYDAMEFNNVFDLKRFLNLNEIEPKDIIEINSNHIHPDRTMYTVLYINKQISEGQE